MTNTELRELIELDDAWFAKTWFSIPWYVRWQLPFTNFRMRRYLKARAHD